MCLWALTSILGYKGNVSWCEYKEVAARIEGETARTKLHSETNKALVAELLRILEARR